MDVLHPERALALTLESLDVPQLRSLAAIRGVEVPVKARKPALIDPLSRIPADPIPGSIDNGGTFISEGIEV